MSTRPPTVLATLTSWTTVLWASIVPLSAALTVTLPAAVTRPRATVVKTMVATASLLTLLLAMMKPPAAPLAP